MTGHVLFGASHVNVHHRDAQSRYTPSKATIHCAAAWEESQHLVNRTLAHGISMGASPNRNGIWSFCQNKGTGIACPTVYWILRATPTQSDNISVGRNLCPQLAQFLRPLSVLKPSRNCIVLQDQRPRCVCAPSGLQSAPVGICDGLLHAVSTALAYFVRRRALHIVCTSTALCELLFWSSPLCGGEKLRCDANLNKALR